MNTIKSLMTLRDEDVFPNKNIPLITEWIDRPTGKVVLFNYRKKIALVGNKVNNFVLLPGGGVEESENIVEGTLRECQEETGCIIKITHELGITDDYRSRDSRHAINYGFIGEVLSHGEQNLMHNEKDIGLHVIWVSLKEASKIFKKQEIELKEGRVDYYNTGFNILRDRFFIESASELLKDC